jgi:magnesium-transporting ATPase (P-type)
MKVRGVLFCLAIILGFVFSAPILCEIQRGRSSSAILTGESVPQSKFPPSSDTKETLQVAPPPLQKTKLNRVTTTKQLTSVPFQPLLPAHRPHILFCGSNVVQLQQGERAARGKMFSPPFGGGVGLVMRTGFCTQKGELLRSISCSGDSVSVNNKEALAFMGVLLVFAVAASGYVLNQSWASGKTTHFKLLMRCIMIITTVSPLQLQLFFRVVDAGPGHPS